MLDYKENSLNISCHVIEQESGGSKNLSSIKKRDQLKTDL